MLLGVDRSDRAHVGLVARRARRALVDVHIQDAVFKCPDRIRARLMRVLGDAAAGLFLGEQCVGLRVELVDALHRTDVDARTILHIDARLCDDRKPGHLQPPVSARADRARRAEPSQSSYLNDTFTLARYAFTRPSSICMSSSATSATRRSRRLPAAFSTAAAAALSQESVLVPTN